MLLAELVAMTWAPLWWASCTAKTPTTVDEDALTGLKVAVGEERLPCGES